VTASEQIDQLIAKLTDWRGETLAGVRKAILAAGAATATSPSVTPGSISTILKPVVHRSVTTHSIK